MVTVHTTLLAYSTPVPHPTQTTHVEYIYDNAVTHDHPTPALRRTQRVVVMHYRDSYCDTNITPPNLPPFPTAACNETEQDNENTKAINDLLVTAGTALSRKRGKPTFVPHLYVIRGDKCEKIGLGEATWHEHFAAMYCMGKDPAIPHAWKAPIIKHLHQPHVTGQHAGSGRNGHLA